MKIGITTIPMGFDQCYLLKGDGLVAVDAGAPNKGTIFLRAMKAARLKPEDLDLVILTHGHWDHIGSAAEIKSATGAEIAMHRSEVQWLEKSMTPLSPGVTTWGKILTAIHKPFMSLIDVPATRVDVVLDDEPYSLERFGIAGHILHTPGHSFGSVTVLLESGEAFVGDHAMNRFPLRLSPGLPIFAEDQNAVISSWEYLIESGATVIYPAHGKPFPVAVIKKAISRAG